MPDNQTDFNKSNFIAEFNGAVALLDVAEKAGVQAACDGVRKLFFASCGAPFQMMRSVAYWAEKYSKSTDVRVYHAGELINLDPAGIDENTLVFLGSHSGATREVIESAQLLSNKPCKTIAFSQESDSALGQNVDKIFAYGLSKQGYFSSLMLTLAFTSAYLKEREKNWHLHDDLIDSLKSFPAALADAKEYSLRKGKILAGQLHDAENVYIIGSGPMYTTAYIFAACFLMEMQWMHAFPLSAAEFFHGPFEVFDKDTSVILLLGEDPSRPEAERVLSFLQKHTNTPNIYDSRDYSMAGIHQEVRPIFAPFVLDAALTNLVEEIAELNQHPLTVRRYMGKVDY